MLFCDLDRFKWVNDTLGHTSGDELLRAIAARLRGAVRPSDVVARFGGDEFALLCEVGGSESASTVADRLTAAVSEPVDVSGHTIHITVSIGIALVLPDDDTTPQALLRDADLAMYRAKEQGRARTVFFDTTLHERAVARMELESDLRRAIDHGEFAVAYQPVIEVSTGQTVGVEALLRWNHPLRGSVPTPEFVLLAEETGLIVPIGEWVLAQACHEVAAWNRRHPDRRPLTVSVNLSARQLDHSGLVGFVARVLAETGLDPALLWLEITETALMEDSHLSLLSLSNIKALGVTLAVDDFGTGYASFLYVRRLPVDVLKIDKSFVAGMDRSSADAAIVAGVVRLARSLGMIAVAEGVERAEHAARLNILGCELAQGYFWSHPAPLEVACSVSPESHATALGALPDAVRLVLVDDDHVAREVVRVMLEMDYGFEIVGECGTGAESIELCETLQPDVVLLDLALPDVSGLDVIPELRRVAPTTQVVAVTAYDQGPNNRGFGGADAVVLKGAEITSVGDRLKSLLALAES